VDLSAGSGKLSFALKTLRARWETTQPQWSDDVSRDFQENHLGPLEAQVMATLTAINLLGQVLAQARHECE
jgi:hypothetical protein